jgi:predicted Zn-dependent peptidase
VALADAMLRPTFATAEVDLVREQQLASLAESYDDPRSVAEMAAWAQWYGEGHPLARPVLGMKADLDGLTADHLRDSWRSRLVPERVTIVATGAVEPEALKAALDARLGGWAAPEAPVSLAVPAAQGVEAGGTSLRFVDVPGASQTTLRTHAAGWSATDPAAPVANLGVIALGGTFTSRLNRLLREEKGYTYGARARSSTGPDSGTVVITTAVQRDVTAPALSDLLAAGRDWVTGISEDEVAKAAGARRTSVLSWVASRSDLADVLAGRVARGQAPDSMATELETIGTATHAEVNPLLTAFGDNGVLVVVAGDLSAIQEGVEAQVPGAWSTVEPPR